MAYITENVQTKRKIKVLPCIECGNDDIDIGDCGYSSFNVAWGKCKKCGNKIEINNCCCSITKRTIAKRWNDANNPEKLIAGYKKQIKSLQSKIDKLSKKV